MLDTDPLLEFFAFLLVSKQFDQIWPREWSPYARFREYGVAQQIIVRHEMHVVYKRVHVKVLLGIVDCALTIF